MDFDLDFDIEIQSAHVEQSDSVLLPMNFLTFGEIKSNDVQVYIRQSVYKALEKLALSDTRTELGSILLGQYCKSSGVTHVIISEYIEAKYTDASAATLTFTHDTWDYIHKEHARRYPDLKIIGWQHTHPNYGISCPTMICSSRKISSIFPSRSLTSSTPSRICGDFSSGRTDGWRSCGDITSMTM